MPTIELLEIVKRLSDGKILLKLKSGGKPSYQYVYRAAAGVYWSEHESSFTFDAQSNSDPKDSVEHVRRVVRDEMKILLLADAGTVFENVPNCLLRNL
ncbi:hypothetical protein KDM90_16415 [Undibacterium sp. FT137W]|uniref:Uncharacterized protein n=1 Tax=Undibacterium fentianense TaxID=2828728 RepID=A0A941E5S8_9BURK|nr:hypothetical protein [Undibacterium fentianense]